MSSKYKLEYIWLDGYEPSPNLRSKTKIVDFEPKKAEDCPIWGFDGSSTQQAEGHDSDCMLHPVALYPDSGRRNGFLVMCEVHLPKDKGPHPSNTRALISDNDNGLWLGFEQDDLAHWADIFVEEGYFSPDDAERLAERAKNLGLGLRMHVDQMQDSGGAALAARLGAATADHLEFTSESGIAALAEAGVVPVLLPGSVLGLGKNRYPNARAMIEAGLPVVVATDFNPGSSPCPSLPTTLSLACTMMGMTPEEALTSATVNAAYSLGLGHEVGSIEEGKRADFVIHDAEDWRETLVYSGRDTASEVYVAGNRVL